jgi:hypothetical protein
MNWFFSSSKLNFEDCKIKTDSKLNVDFFKFMLKDYFDYEICKFLEYGFCISSVCRKSQTQWKMQYR